MIVDAHLELADAWSHTTMSGTTEYVATNVIDLGPLGGSPTANTTRDIAAGRGLSLEILTQVGVTSDGSATLQFKLKSDVASTLDSAAVTHHDTGALAKTVFATAGTKLSIPLPRGSYKRYLGVTCTVGAAALTAGAFQVKIVPTEGVQDNIAYAGASPIS